MNIYTKPSYYALVLNGLVILIILILTIKNYKKIQTEDIYKIILLLILFNILIGVHGLLHVSLERTYNYNPIEIILNKIKKY
jgi:hypothetical protein